MLDSTLQELQPAIRRGLADQPGVPADDPFAHPDKSELLQSLHSLMDAALARAGAFNSDDDEPDLSALAQEAHLTRAEFEAVAMTSDGWSREDVAKFQHVSLEAVRSSYRRGLQKMRQYVLNSTSATFPASVLEGFASDEL